MLLAQINTGMNWEIAAVKAAQLKELLESAKSRINHNCTVEIDEKAGNDGGPYWCNTATFYYLSVYGSKDTNPKFIEGIKSVLAEI